MLIVLSYPTLKPKEALHINALFELGMPLFHLRKPDLSKKEYADLLEQIDPKYRSQIAIHQHPDLADDFGLKRIHLSESGRLRIGLDGVEKYRKRGFHLSSSIHRVEDYANLSDAFEYTFISPVFDSISKAGHKASPFDWSQLPAKRKVKVIGLGGISAKNCHEVLKMGLDGIGILGSIWKSENPLLAYQQFTNT